MKKLQIERTASTYICTCWWYIIHLSYGTALYSAHPSLSAAQWGFTNVYVDAFSDKVHLVYSVLLCVRVLRRGNVFHDVELGCCALVAWKDVALNDC